MRKEVLPLLWEVLGDFGYLAFRDLDHDGELIHHLRPGRLPGRQLYHCAPKTPNVGLPASFGLLHDFGSHEIGSPEERALPHYGLELLAGAKVGQFADALSID